MQQQAVILLNAASKCSGFNNTVAYNRINFTTGICSGFGNNYRSLRYCIKYSIKYSLAQPERIALVAQLIGRLGLHESPFSLSLSLALSRDAQRL